MGKGEPIKENADSQIANKKNAASQNIVKEKAINTLPLIFDEDCKVLILGSFPGKKSRDAGFYYCNSNNGFWDVLEEIFKKKNIPNYKVPNCVLERRRYLLDHYIAVWDVCSCCYIEDSKDKTIEIVATNPICWLLEVLKERGRDISNDLTIFCNGDKAYKLYNAHIKPRTQKKAELLLSTSRGNRNNKNMFANLVGSWQKVADSVYGNN